MRCSIICRTTFTILIFSISLAALVSNQQIYAETLQKDTMSFNLNEVLKNYNGNPNSYYASYGDAYVNSLYEVGFGSISTSNVGRVVFSWWEFVPDQQTGSRRLFIVDDKGAISEMIVSQDKLPEVNALQTVVASEFRSITPLVDQHIMTSVKNSQGSFSISITKYSSQMDKELLKISMDVGQTEPLFPQTQLFTFKDNGPSFYLTFEASNDYFDKNKTKNKIYWQEAASEGSISGILTLDKKNKFVQDVGQILSITTITESKGLNPWRVYISFTFGRGNEIGVAGCNLAFVDDKLQIKDPSDCGQLNGLSTKNTILSVKVSDFTNGDTSNPSGEVYIARKGKQSFYLDKIEQQRCTINLVTKGLENCTDQSYPLILDDLKLHSLVELYPGSQDQSQKRGVITNFSNKIQGDNYYLIQAVLFQNPSSEKFCIIRDLNSDYLAISLGYEINSLSIRRNLSYSKYAFSTNGQADFQIITGESKSTFTDLNEYGKTKPALRVSYTVSENSFSAVDSQLYGSSEIYAEKTSKAYRMSLQGNVFSGNFVEYELSTTSEQDFQLITNSNWPQQALDSLINISKKLPYFVGPSSGVVATSRSYTLAKFVCIDPLYPNFTCEQKSEFDLDNLFTLIYARQAISPRQFSQSEENSIIAVVNTSGNTKLVRFPQDGQAAIILSIENFSATEQNSVLINSGSNSVFAILRKNQVEVYFWDIMAVNPPQKLTLTYKDFKFLTETEFNPDTLNSNPANSTQIYLSLTTTIGNSIMSKKIYTIDISQDKTDASKILATVQDNYKSLDFQGQGKFCSFGQEHILWGQQQGKMISSISLHGYGNQRIDFDNYGFDLSKSELICVPGSTVFIILDRSDIDKQKYMVVFGNRINRIFARYHSLEDLSQGELSGYQFVSAFGTDYGLNIVLEKQSESKIYRVIKSVFLEGPYLNYVGDTTQVTEKTCNMSASAKSGGTGFSLSLSINKFDPAVTFQTQISLQKGSQDLVRIANFEGHTINFKVVYQEKDSNKITIQNRLQASSQSKTVSGTNFSPTDIIINRSQGSNLGYYTYQELNRFNVYYFVVNDKVDLLKTFTIDLPEGMKLNSAGSLSMFDTNLFIFGMYASNNLSSSQLNWFSIHKQSGFIETGILKTYSIQDFFATQVKLQISKMMSDVIMILATDETKKLGFIFMADITKNQEEETGVKIIAEDTIYNFGCGEIVQFDSIEYPYLLYSLAGSRTIICLYYKDDWEYPFKERKFYFQNNLAIMDIKCTKVDSSDEVLNNLNICTLTQSSPTLYSLVIKDSSPQKGLPGPTIVNNLSGIMRQVGNYIPVYVENYYDLAVVKARTYDAQGNVTDEKMFFYTRGKHPSEYVAAGVSSSQYIPDFKSPSTPALPVLVSEQIGSDISTKSVIFFQEHVENTAGFTYNSVILNVNESITKSYSENVKIIVNEFLGTDSTVIPLGKIFSIPYTQRYSDMEYMLFKASIVLLAMIIVCLIVRAILRKRKQNIETDPVQEGQYSTQNTEGEIYKSEQDTEVKDSLQCSEIRLRREEDSSFRLNNQPKLSHCKFFLVFGEYSKQKYRVRTISSL